MIQRCYQQKTTTATPASHATGRNLTQVALQLLQLMVYHYKVMLAQTSNETGVAISTEEGVSANLGAKYTMGQVTVGYVEGGYQPAVASGE